MPGYDDLLAAVATPTPAPSGGGYNDLIEAAQTGRGHYSDLIDAATLSTTPASDAVVAVTPSLVDNAAIKAAGERAMAQSVQARQDHIPGGPQVLTGQEEIAAGRQLAQEHPWLNKAAAALTAPIPGAAAAIHAGYQYGSPLGWIEDVAPNSTAGKWARDVRTALEGTATGFATPLNIGLGAATAGVGPTVGRLIGLGFTAQQAHTAYQTYEEWAKATDPEQKHQLGIKLGVDVGLTALLGGATAMPHPVGERVVEPAAAAPPPVEPAPVEGFARVAPSEAAPPVPAETLVRPPEGLGAPPEAAPSAPATPAVPAEQVLAPEVPLPSAEAAPEAAPTQAAAVPAAAEAPPEFAPYADEILKSAKYIDNPEARAAADASGLYNRKEKTVNLGERPQSSQMSRDFIRAHEEAHHIWDGLQNVTAAELMRDDPAAFEAFRESSAGKSQIIRHKITGENINEPSRYDWIEAVPDLYAEMKVKGIRNPALESWLEKAIPEENKPAPRAAEPPQGGGGPIAKLPPPETPGTQPSPVSGINNERLVQIHGPDAITAGKGRSASAWKQVGQADKRDPYAVLENARKQGIATPADVANLRTEHQRLLNDARNAYGTPQYNELAKRAVDMANAIKGVAHGPASDVFRALQEQDIPRYESPADFDNIIRERMNRESTPEEKSTFQGITNDIAARNGEAVKAATDAQTRLRQSRPKAAKEPMKFEDAADYIRKQIAELTKDCTL